MSTVLHILAVLALVLVGLFLVTFVIYFFNLEMKLLSVIEPLLVKVYDRVKRDRHL